MSSRKGRKILIILFLIMAILAPFFIVCCANMSTTNSNSSMEATKYTANIVLDDKGDMHVQEIIVIDNYTDRYNNYFYREIAYNKNNMFGNSTTNNSHLVEDARLVVEDDTGIVYDSSMNNDVYPSHFSGFSYNNDVDERGYRLRCESSTSMYCDTIFYYNRGGFSTITTFTYEYTIEGVVTQYKDISEFNWVLLDYQPFKIGDVEINVTLPSGNYDISGEDTFFHGSGNATREFVGNNKIFISADELSTKEQIEVRLLLDNSVFSNVRAKNKVNIEARADILNFEKEQEKAARITFIVGIAGSIVVFVIFILVLGLLVWMCYKKHDKEYESEFYNEYYRELPATYSPSVMGYLYRFREINDDDLVASLLDLIRRKYLLLDMNGSGIEDKNPNYIISVNKEKSQNGLTQSEKYLIKWFIKEIGNGESVSFNQLNSFCESYSGAQSYQSSSNAWYKLVKSEASKYDFFETDKFKFKSKYTSLGVIISIPFIFLLILINFISGHILSVGLITSIIFLLIAYSVYVNGIDRRTKNGNEDFVRWRAFKKFLEDFSSFEDYSVPSLIVWEHYLVYATSFGIADKVSEQLKLKFNLEQISSVDCTFVVYFGLEHRIGRFGRTIRGMRYASHATVARHQAQRSSGSFGGRSGGGFSGGSSFGGGGGSFGGGRR